MGFIKDCFDHHSITGNNHNACYWAIGIFIALAVIVLVLGITLGPGLGVKDE